MNQRLRLALIVAVFFAVPALLTLLLIESDHANDAPRGMQPGGAIAGRVLDHEGRGVAGIDVGLLLDPAGPPADPTETFAARTKSGPDGRFELAAPPLEGRYAVVAGGGTWQHAVSAFSFVGRKAGDEFELKVLPGCELELRFTRADGSVPGTGRYELEGQSRGAIATFFGEPALRRQGEFADGLLRIEALPPIGAKLFVRFETGETFELALELVAGRVEKQIKL